MSRSRARFVVAPLHPDLTEALLDDLSAAAPDARPALLVPNRALGTGLARLQARRRGASIDLVAWTWGELARALLRPEPGSRSRAFLHDEAAAWLVRRLQDRRGRGPTVFDRMLDVRGFRSALHSTFEDLARAGLVRQADIERLLVRHGAAMPLEARHTLLLYLAYRRSFEPTHDDRASLLDRAARVPAGRVRAVVGPALWVHGSLALAPVEARLLSRLASEPDFDLRVLVGAPESGAPPLRLQLLGLGFEAEEPPAARPPWTPERRVVCAPSGEAEAEEVAREILRGVDAGLRFGDIAVLVRRPARLAALHEAFVRREIPCALVPGPSLLASRAGRALALFLDLVAREIEPEGLLAFTAVAPFRAGWAGLGPDATPSAWARVVRAVSARGGEAAWVARLVRYRDEQRRAAGDLERRDDPALRARREAEAADELHRVVGALRRSRAAFPKRGSWGDHVAAADAFLGDALDGDPMLPDLRAALARLAALDGLGGPRVGRADFRDSARTLLAESRPEAAPVAGANAVLMGTAAALHGLAFDMVCIAGVQDGEWPGPPAPDPVLRERERAALAPLLPSDVALDEPGERLRRDRRLFEAGCRAARRRLVLTYARLDPVTGGPRLPAALLLEWASQLEGRSLDYADFENLPWVERVPLRRLHFDAGTPVLGPDELDTAAALALPPGAARRYAQGLGECAAHGAALDWLRNHVPRFTRADGRLGGREARQKLASRFTRPSLSASQIVTYASCPFRYFLRYVLRVEPLESEDPREISGRDLGRLAHQVLERFHAELQATGASLPELSPAALAAALATAADAVLSAAEAESRTGAPYLWAIRKQVLLEDLARFLREEKRRARPAAASQACESPFGGQVLLQSPAGVPIALHGTIDRLEREPTSGAVHVVDYKTGRPLAEKEEPRAAQLAVYLWAATRGDARALAASDGRFAYVTRRGRFAEQRLAGRALDERRADFVLLVGGIVDAVRAGEFFPFPGPAAQRCEHCDYRGLCDARVADQFARKSASGAVLDFLALPDFAPSLETREPESVPGVEDEP